MKKLLAILILLTLCLTGCNKEKTRIEQLLDEGYQIDFFGGNLAGFRKGEEELEDYIIFTLNVSDAVQNKIDSLDFFSDSYFDDAAELYAECEILEETNCMQYVPSDEEVQKYVGMTLGELAGEGFEEWGSMVDETGATYEMDNGYFRINVRMDPALNFDTQDDFSYNEILEMKIVEVEVGGLSSNIASTLGME